MTTLGTGLCSLMGVAVNNPHHRSIALLVLVTLVWGTSFPLQKYVVAELQPAVILSVRFMVAAIALSPWLRYLNLRLLREGGLLGILYFTECTLALMGLETISASRSAFIISLNAILVPVLAGTLLRRQLPTNVVVAATIAVFGIGIMSWEGGGLSQGDGLSLICAFGVAVYILLLERIAPRHPSLPLAATQISVMAILSTIWAAPQLIHQIEPITHHLNALLYLGLAVSVMPIWGQALAQRWVASYEAALIYTMEPVFALLLSFLFLGETLGLRGGLGAGFILLAMLLSQVSLPQVMPLFSKRGDEAIVNPK